MNMNQELDQNAHSNLDTTVYASREDQVAVFNKIMGQPIAENHLDVPLKLRQLGIKLIFEELAELAKASGCEKTFLDLCLTNVVGYCMNLASTQEMDNEEKQDVLQEFEVLKEGLFEIVSDNDTIDEVEQIDGLVDVQYTLSWAVNVFDHKSRFTKAFDEVCASNNSKACKNMDEAQRTVKHWNAQEGFDCYIEEIEGHYVVKNKLNNGKVVKSVDYMPTNYKLLFPVNENK